MLEPLVLGVAQGIAEWLPVSSEGLIVLIRTNLFGADALGESVRVALFLHLGTFLAALLYFRADVIRLTKRLFTNWTKRPLDTDGKIIIFLVVATLISGGVGYGFLSFAETFESIFQSSGTFINISIALLLGITGILQLVAKSEHDTKSATMLSARDGILLGIVQGFAALPGLSRSGLTVSALLLRGFAEEEALRLSFLLSLPIVLAGNIVLNFNTTVFSLENLVALLAAFGCGYATIHVLLSVARKINFGYFVLAFAGLMFIAAFI